MDITILNKNIAHTPEIEQAVNAIVALAVEQGITPDTDVDVDAPMTLGSIEVTGMHTETQAEVDPQVQLKDDGPEPF